MVAHAREAAPEEACGILAGMGDTVTKVYELENAAHSPVEYRVDQKEQLRVFNEIWEAGLDDLAYYHSHPASLPYPSATDVRTVFVGRARLVIVSLRNPDEPEIKSFFVEDGEIEEEEVRIVTAPVGD